MKGDCEMKNGRINVWKILCGILVLLLIETIIYLSPDRMYEITNTVDFWINGLIVGLPLVSIFGAYCFGKKATRLNNWITKYFLVFYIITTINVALYLFINNWNINTEALYDSMGWAFIWSMCVLIAFVVGQSHKKEDKK